MNFKRMINGSAPQAVVLIRLAVGAVFLSEGIQKFLYAAENGVGRFAKIGIPAPDVMAPFVGVVEIACGALILIGFLTRLAAIPLIIDMIVAILSRPRFRYSWGMNSGDSVFALFLTTVSGEYFTRHAPILRCCSARSFC